MQRLTIFCLLICSCSLLFGQGLYMPLDYQKAYEKGTRMADGTVSSSYWQNTTTYKIQVTVDPEKKLLTGQAQIRYTNNSPDSLTRIYFHAYHDYYKAGANRAGFFSAPDQTDINNEGMVLDKVMVGDQTFDMANKENFKWRGPIDYRGTNYGLKLDQKLAPGTSINIAIDWHFDIVGEGFERSGAIDDGSMFIAYWYPEIAVYDDVFGWDNITYDASAEFYHDVADFEVEITVPKEYAVWASVAPDNPKEIYPKKILDRLEEAKNAEEVITIIGEDDLEKGLKMKGTTWKYTAKQFPDFSFALSNHFAWAASSYHDQFGDYFLNGVYDPSSPRWRTVVDAQKTSLEVFHNRFPVYEFPFHYFTVFDGLQGGGMEFAGMANDAGPSVGLTLHEMCHMYFPFLMGINEKRYAWMDEGMASFVGYFLKPTGPPRLRNNPRSFLGSSSILPVMTPTYLAPRASGVNSYTIGSMSYHALYHLLGDEVFTKAMKHYMDTWKQKHPTPYDFFNSIETSSGMDLDWFWKSWYQDWGYADIGIQSFDNNVLTLENLGGRPISVRVTYTLEDGSTMAQQVNPMVWKDSPIHQQTVVANQAIKKVQITLRNSSDAVADNNIWEK